MLDETETPPREDRRARRGRACRSSLRRRNSVSPAERICPAPSRLKARTRQDSVLLRQNDVGAGVGEDGLCARGPAIWVGRVHRPQAETSVASVRHVRGPAVRLSRQDLGAVIGASAGSGRRRTCCLVLVPPLLLRLRALPAAARWWRSLSSRMTIGWPLPLSRRWSSRRSAVGRGRGRRFVTVQSSTPQ